MSLKKTEPMELDTFVTLVERLDAWAVNFARAYVPKIDAYIMATDEERRQMPDPIPVKKARVMFRVTRILINVVSAKRAGKIPSTITVYSLEGGFVPGHYAGLVPMSNRGLSMIRKDAKALKSCITVSKPCRPRRKNYISEFENLLWSYAIQNGAPVVPLRAQDSPATAIIPSVEAVSPVNQPLKNEQDSQCSGDEEVETKLAVSAIA